METSKQAICNWKHEQRPHKTNMFLEDDDVIIISKLVTNQVSDYQDTPTHPT